MSDGRSLPIPAGIDDARARRLVGLVDERWDGSTIGVDRVLVMHLQSVAAPAVPALVEQLGLGRFGFIVAPPRELLRRGLALLRVAGTPGAIAAVVAGAVGVEPRIEERLARHRDGTIDRRGTLERHGADASPYTCRVWVDLPSALSAESARELWDLIGAVRRQAVRLCAVVENLPPHDASSVVVHFGRP